MLLFATKLAPLRGGQRLVCAWLLHENNDGYKTHRYGEGNGHVHLRSYIGQPDRARNYTAFRPPQRGASFVEIMSQFFVLQRSTTPRFVFLCLKDGKFSPNKLTTIYFYDQPCWRSHLPKKGNVDEHVKMMRRSYGLAFGAVTLHFYILLFHVFGNGVNFDNNYVIIAFLSWVPNLVLVEVINSKAIPQPSPPAP